MIGNPRECRVGKRRDGAHLGDQPRGLQVEHFRLVALHQARVITTRRVDHRRQNRHRMRRRREALEVMLHALVEHFVVGEQIGEAPHLRVGRQLPVDHEVGRFDEIGMLGQLLDRVAPQRRMPLSPSMNVMLLAHDPGIAVAVVEGDVARWFGAAWKCPRPVRLRCR